MHLFRALLYTVIGGTVAICMLWACCRSIAPSYFPRLPVWAKALDLAGVLFAIGLVIFRKLTG